MVTLMTSPLAAEICYFVLMPVRSVRPQGTPEPVPVQKDVPYFFDVDIGFVPAGERRFEVAGVAVQARFQVLDEQVWLAECRYRLDDILGETANARKQHIQTAVRESFQAETGYSGAFIEEYTIVLLGRLELPPDEFVDTHAPALTRLLRSLDKPFTEVEVGEILGARARYSRGDLTVVDWEGAIIIAEDNDFQSDLELLKIGNYQLLHYRLLDRAIERSLQELRGYVARHRISWFPARSSRLQQIVEQRLTLLLDFEKTDQSLLLIGDWYSAQVYRLIVDEFYLDEWKAAVSAKLDTFAALDEIVRQNLAFSWDRLLDFVQIIGWLILLIGYFVLFFLDLGWFR